MTTNTVKAISYITSVACEEIPLKYWLIFMSHIFQGKVPDDITLATVINYYASKMPNFEKRAENTTQESYDDLYKDFLDYVLKETGADNFIESDTKINVKKNEQQ